MESTPGRATPSAPDRSRPHALISGQAGSGRIIDLASGPDEAPIRITAVPAGLPAVVGHTFDYADQRAPVYTNAELVSPAGLNLDCPACSSWLHVRPQRRLTLLVLQHEAGCTWLLHTFLASAQ